jgi:hypothetical protein
MVGIPSTRVSVDGKTPSSGYCGFSRGSPIVSPARGPPPSGTSIQNQQTIMKKITTLLAAGIAAIGIQSSAHGVLILNSVDWTVAGIPAQGIFDTTNNITFTTANYGNGGDLFSFDWGSMPFASGFSTTSNDAVAIAYTAGTSTTTIAFSESISNLSLWFNYIDSETTFDFTGLNWTFIGGNNASRSGDTVVSTGSNDEFDGFLVNVAGSFGPSASLSFDITRATADTAGFTLSAPAPSSAVPEPGTWAAAALLVGGAAFARWRQRRTA